MSYKIEYAKSNRSGCVSCKDKIEKDVLRVAKMVQSQKFDGLQPTWFHQKCFLASAGIGGATPAMFEGFADIRPDDQEAFKKALAGASSGASVPLPSGCPELLLEYAKSGRSKCRKCSENITESELRLGMNVVDPDYGNGFPTARWYHRRCFFAALNSENIPLAAITVSAFKGSASIEPADRTDLTQLLESARASAGLPPLSADSKGDGKGEKAPAAKKGKGKKKAAEEEEEEEPPALPETEEEIALKEQAKLLWEIKDMFSGVSTSEMKSVLDENGQNSSGGQATLLDHISDGMAFGALAPCANCAELKWHCRSSGYHCSGNKSEWEPCTVVTKTPPRVPWKLTAGLKENDKFKKWKFVKRERVFPAVGASEAAAAVNPKAEAMDTTSDGKKRTRMPLEGFTLAVAGKLSITQSEVKDLISELGGNLFAGKTIGSSVICLIAPKKDVEKKSAKVTEALKFGVPVVSEAFLLECKKEKKCVLMLPHVLEASSTVIEPSREIMDADRDADRKKAKTTNDGTNPKMAKLVVKGRAAVDPQSGMQDSCHVLEEGKTVWNASLALTNLKSNTNSYYKLQVLIDDKTSRASLFRSWGRTGTDVGGFKLEAMSNKEAAKRAFADLFTEKTGGNNFESPPYTKVPGSFFPLEMDYGESGAKKAVVAKGSRTKLHGAIQDLINLIFDVETFKSVMQEMDLDLTKMPLGKLSRHHLEASMSVLTELQDLLKRDDLPEAERKGKVLAASNRFYTMIPHDFGLASPPLIDTDDLLKDKIRLLDDLLSMEVAARLLEESGDSGENDPLDVYYKKLHSDLEPIEHDSDEFRMIVDYVKNTHAETHASYSLEVEQAFVLRRHGEDERFKTWKSLHNRRLLWHGSRLTNWCGIISEGLRIAPPSAPATGYMFGKGVYFADMVSKSANYCFTNRANPTGLMLLSEVALGNMHELTGACYVEKLPVGKHSTFGMGKTHPDPKGARVLSDGMVVPMGKGTASNVKSTSLLYNEFIVYDVSQVNMKYLLKMKFNYK